MSSTDVDAVQNVEARLPPEIEYEIFILAFRDSVKKKTNLLLVAKRVFEWLAPFAYRSLFVDDDHYPPLGFLERVGRHVKDLHVVSADRGNASNIHANAFLTCCPNVRNLAFWNSMDLTEKVVSLTKLTHLFSESLRFFEPYYYASLPESVSLHTAPMPTIQGLFEPDYRGLLSESTSLPTSLPWLTIQAFFSSITHLGFLEPIRLKEDDATTPFPIEIQILLSFTSLTHLLVYEDTNITTISLILTHCSNIEVFICLEYAYTHKWKTYLRSPALEDTHYDPRIVFIDGDFQADWLRGVEGEKDMWVLAGEIVAQRRRNTEGFNA